MDQAGIFTEGDILDTVQAILDAPMSALERQEDGWRAALGLQTRDAILHLSVADAMLLPGPFQSEDLRQSRPLDIAGQIGGRDQVPHLLLPSVATLDGARFTAVDERQRVFSTGWRIEQSAQIALKQRLIAFDQQEIVATGSL